MLSSLLITKIMYETCRTHSRRSLSRWKTIFKSEKKWSGAANYTWKAERTSRTVKCWQSMSTCPDERCRPLRPKNVMQCWNCDMVGHRAQDCQQPQRHVVAVQRLSQPVKKEEGPTATSLIKIADVEVYVCVKLGQKNHRALLDTGCSKTILP